MNTATVFLILTIVTGPDQPDINKQIPEPSIEACIKDAAEFLNHGVPKIDGAVAIVGGCMFQPAAGEKT